MVRIPARSSGSGPRLLPPSRRYFSGNSRSTPAGRRAQTPTAATDVDAPRPRLLDHPSTSVAPMVERADHRETGDRGPVASSRLSPLLALAITSSRRPTADRRRHSDPYPPLGDGES